MHKDCRKDYCVMQILENSFRSGHTWGIVEYAWKATIAHARVYLSLDERKERSIVVYTATSLVD